MVLFFIVLGILGTLIIQSLAGTLSFYIFAVAFSFLYFFLLFRFRTQRLSLILIGLCVGLELYGSQRMGLPLIFGGILLMWARYTPVLLRFTTPVLHGIVGLLMVIPLYAGILFPWSGFLTRCLYLLPGQLIVIVATGLMTRSLFDRSNDLT